MNEEETKEPNSTEGYEGTLATAPDHEDTPGTGEENSDLTIDETHRAGANSFANMLVEAGMLSLQQLVISQETARRDKVSFVRILERDGLILSRDLAALLALHTGMPMAELRSETIDPAAVAVLPEEVARKYTALPISKSEGSLAVALSDPTDLLTIQDLTIRTGHIIEPVVATPKDILEHIDLSYRLTEVNQDPGESQAEDVRVTAKLIRDAQPAEVIDLLLRQALQDRTSDIHIQPTDTKLRIRFRIDGIHQIFRRDSSVMMIHEGFCG